jgi:Holliday junction resolvase RusA-like endonuclease
LLARILGDTIKDDDMKIEIFVPGKPAPGGSKTGFYIKKINRVVMTPASKKTKPWMQLVRSMAETEYQGELLTGPLKFKMEFRILRPKGHFGTGKNAGVIKDRFIHAMPEVRPDLTKYVRSTEDALVGVIWRDDSQVCVQENAKVYVSRDPGVIITIMDIWDFEYTPHSKESLLDIRWGDKE